MNGISCVGDECVQMGKDIAEGIWLWKMENTVYVLIGLAAAFVLISAVLGAIELFGRIRSKFRSRKEKRR